MTVATFKELESKILIKSGSSFLLRNHTKTSTISSLNKEIQLLARSLGTNFEMRCTLYNLQQDTEFFTGHSFKLEATALFWNI